jgi:ketosteroid isomerase-like protein
MNTVNREADERELRELVEAFLNAFITHDVKYVEQALPDDFVAILPDGRLVNKASELENVRNLALESCTTDQFQVYWYGDTLAVTNFILSIKLKGQEATQVRDSHVYIYRDGRWQMIMGQATPLVQPWVL